MVPRRSSSDGFAGLARVCAATFVGVEFGPARVASAVLFAVVAGRIFWGEPLLPTSAPLPFYAYPFLVMTLISWIWSLLRERSA